MQLVPVINILVIGQTQFLTIGPCLRKNDMKKTWGVISDTLKRNRKSKSQAECIYKNHVVRDTDEIANHFNDYFINIASTPSQQIQPTHSFNNYLNNNSMLRFKFQPVDQNHISQLIDKLKN